MQNTSLSAMILAAGFTGCAHSAAPADTSLSGATPSGAPDHPTAATATPSANTGQRSDAPAAASASPGTPATETSSRFLAAVRAGDLPTVQQLLARDPGLGTARTERGMSALKVALFRLQDNREDFYAPAQNSTLQAILAAHPALDPYETAAVGNATALAALIARDPALIVTRFPGSGWMLLHFAAFGGNVQAVRLLLDHGAAIEERAANKFANTPLHVALLTGDHATTKLLIERGANLEARYETGTTPLHLAAGLGRVDLLTLLLDHGAAIDARMDDGTTALSLAVKGKHLEAAELLRRRGAKG